MFTAFLAKAKLLALAGVVGGSAAYATHAVTQKIDQTQPQTQDQQADPQLPGDQQARDAQNDPQRGRPDGYQGFGDRAQRFGEGLIHLIDRRVDRQIDKRLADRFSCQPGGQQHHREGPISHFEGRSHRR